MGWYKDWGMIESLLVIVFFIAYLLFSLRVRRTGVYFKSHSLGIVGKAILRTLIFGCFLAAWLGPSFGAQKREVKVIGKDLYVCIDLSKSMNAMDIQPSRLEKIKFELTRVIDALAGDRIGIIIFSTEGFMQSPLTFDHGILKSLYLETLHTGLVPHGGTDFGSPLELALEKHKVDKIAGKNHAKLVLLISDGEDFGENTSEVVEKLENEGVRIFTLGIGTAEGGKIPEGNRYKRNEQGEEIISKMTSESLKKIAKASSGVYYEISDKKNDVDKLIQDIQRLEGDLKGVKEVDVSANKFYYPLAIGLLLLLVDILIRNKLFTF